MVLQSPCLLHVYIHKPNIWKAYSIHSLQGVKKNGALDGINSLMQPVFGKLAFLAISSKLSVFRAHHNEHLIIKSSIRFSRNACTRTHLKG